MKRQKVEFRRASIIALILCALLGSHGFGQDAPPASAPATARIDPVSGQAEALPPPAVLQLPPPLPDEAQVLAEEGAAVLYESQDFFADPPPIPADVAAKAMQALSTPWEPPGNGPSSLGALRLPFAMFEIDSARPTDVLRIRYDSGFDVNRPDRSEYFWGAIGKAGPAVPVNNVNFQQFSLYNETSIGNASGFLSLPITSVSSDTDSSSTGIGNFVIGAKSVLFEGPDFFYYPTPDNNCDKFQVSTIFRTYISFSPALAQRGLTTGHVSLEPGLLANYQYSPVTMFHGEFKYWAPIAGTAGVAGNVVTYGVGVSHTWYSGPWNGSTYDVAVIPTLELIGMQFASGGQTSPDGMLQSAQTTVLNIQPGIRLPVGDRIELGVSAAQCLTHEHFYESLVRFDLRWFW